MQAYYKLLFKPVLILSLVGFIGFVVLLTMTLLKVVEQIDLRLQRQSPPSAPLR
jgi:hypothetical protein